MPIIRPHQFNQRDIVYFPEPDKAGEKLILKRGIVDSTSRQYPPDSRVEVSVVGEPRRVSSKRTRELFHEESIVQIVHGHKDSLKAIDTRKPVYADRILEDGRANRELASILGRIAGVTLPPPVAEEAVMHDLPVEPQEPHLQERSLFSRIIDRLTG